METKWQVIVIMLVATAVVLYRKESWRNKIISALPSTTPDEKKNMILVGVTLAVLNLMLWGMIPWLWLVLTYKWYTLTMINLGLGTFLYLSKADTKKLATIIGVVLIFGLLTNTYYAYNIGTKISSFGSSDISSTTTIAHTNLSYGVPEGVALAIIADCESGDGSPGSAKHFGKDGVTPLKNKEGSTAIGKYQILASAHEERAKNMGFDIKTPEGNEGYARVLFRESGSKHWEVDPRSKSCWEPRLKAFATGEFPKGTPKEIILVVNAPTERFSERITLPRWGDVGVYEIDEFGREVTLQYNGDILEDVPRPKGKDPKNPDPLHYFRVRSREEDPVPVRVRFYIRGS